MQQMSIRFDAPRRYTSPTVESVDARAVVYARAEWCAAERRMTDDGSRFRFPIVTSFTLGDGMLSPTQDAPTMRDPYPRRQTPRRTDSGRTQGGNEK